MAATHTQRFNEPAMYEIRNGQ